jgi:predicted transcriptional regulator
MMGKIITNAKLEDLKNILDAKVIGNESVSFVEIKTVSASDLMSDVLAFVKEDSLLLTGLVNQQVVRTAEMAGITAICFVRGKVPQEETIILAKEKNIPLLATELSLYEASGRLHEKGLHGYDEIK